MTYSESSQLLETWKRETYRVHGAIEGTAYLTGGMMALMQFLLSDDYKIENSREACVEKIIKEINKLKNEPTAK